MPDGHARAGTAPPRGFVIYGSVPFDTPWLYEQNLAWALASRHPVLFVEPPMSPLTPLRHVRARRQPPIPGSFLCRPRRAGRLLVLRPLAMPPLRSRHAQALSQPLVRAQVRSAARRLGVAQPVVVAMGALAGLVGAVGESRRVFFLKDWNEAGSALLGRSREDLRADMEASWASADLIFTVTPALQRTLAGRGFSSVVLPHGFAADLAERYEAHGPAPELASLPRPILGYAGRVDGRLDFELLRALSERFARGSIVLVGPISPRLPQSDLQRIAGRPNVHFVAAKTRQQLPLYLTRFDCALMPYRTDEWLAHASPVKLWDYLYAGAPIVGSGCTVLRDYPPPLVHFAEGSEQFGHLVEVALSENGAGRTARRAVALDNTWDARAREFEALLV